MDVANFYICNILQMHNFGASAIIAGPAGEGEIMPGDNQIMSEHNWSRVLRCIIFVHKKSRQHYAGGHGCLYLVRCRVIWQTPAPPA
ncbi:hypothetical protein [Janthinobacterium sp.]|uniref:hypothetical protein n=1 Tax=Janthinobacterium sp. TaxID=1871054 RepID=UPI00258447C4|nr:hypothetical protein [Janthinobacterium sp.]MCX7289535.1 hypothetical protein [Janthinobacterium sp.]